MAQDYAGKCAQLTARIVDRRCTASSLSKTRIVISGVILMSWDFETDKADALTWYAGQIEREVETW